MGESVESLSFPLVGHVGTKGQKTKGRRADPNNSSSSSSSEDRVSTKSPLCGTMTVGGGYQQQQPSTLEESLRRKKHIIFSSNCRIMSEDLNTTRLLQVRRSVADEVEVGMGGLSHHHHHHHQSRNHWHSSLGMIGALLFVLAAFPTSSVVMCVPLEGRGGGGGGGGDIGGSQQQIVAPGGERLQSKGQLYIPRFLAEGRGDGGGGGVLEQVDDDSRRNFHRFLLDKSQAGLRGENHPEMRIPAVVQKQKEFPQSVDDEEGPEEEGGTTGLALDQINQVENDGNSEWETVIDPHLYVLTEWNNTPFQERFPLLQQQRKRRNSGPSLSIVNPLDVLRQRLLLEIARRKMRQSHSQIAANEEILRRIGKRRR